MLLTTVKTLVRRGRHIPARQDESQEQIMQPLVKTAASFSQCSAIFFALAMGTNIQAETIYDPATDFESGYLNHTNPNGVWSYGYSSGFTGPVTFYTQTVQNGVNGPDARYWLSPPVDIGTSPSAEFNDGGAYNDGNVTFSADQFVLVAGIGGEYSDLIFTAPESGVFDVNGAFTGDQYGIGTLAGIVAHGSLIFNSSVTSVGQVVPFNTAVHLTHRRDAGVENQA